MTKKLEELFELPQNEIDTLAKPTPENAQEITTEALDSLSKIDIVNDMITEKYIISVSSGFYIRMIAKYIKDTFNIDACILSIERIESF